MKIHRNKKYWECYLPAELDAVDNETMEIALGDIDSVSMCEYVMFPEMDVFKMLFNGSRAFW